MWRYVFWMKLTVDKINGNYIYKVCCCAARGTPIDPGVSWFCIEWCSRDHEILEKQARGAVSFVRKNVIRFCNTWSSSPKCVSKTPQTIRVVATINTHGCVITMMRIFRLMECSSSITLILCRRQTEWVHNCSRVRKYLVLNDSN
jgi:hypothetical protein